MSVRLPAVVELSRCHDTKTGNALEVAAIGGCDAEAVCQRRRRDPEVVCTDRPPAALEICPHVGVNAGDSLRDGDWRESCQDVLDERPATIPACTRSAVNTVE